MNSNWVWSLLGALLISALVASDGAPLLHQAPLLLLVIGGALLANLEFVRMAARRRLHPPLTVMQFLSAILASMVFYLCDPHGSDVVLFAVTILLAFFTLVLTNAFLTYWVEHPRAELVKDFLLAFGMGLGSSALLSHALGLRYLFFHAHRLTPDDGPRLVLGVLWIGWGCGAVMAWAHLLLQRKSDRAERVDLHWTLLLPACLATGGALGALLADRMLSLSAVQGLLLGLLLGIAALMGRQLVTWMRRVFDVTYTGVLLPGFGGFWDRFDTVLLGFPLAYYIYRLFFL